MHVSRRASRIAGRLALAAAAALLAAAAGLRFELGHLPAALQRAGPAAPAVLVDDVRIVSMAPGAPPAEAGGAVLVVGETIAAVGAAGSLQAPPGTRVVDGRGYTLMPGLIDAHIHLSDEAELAGYLAHGVTGVRNMSGYPFHLALARRIADGDLAGPDFVTTGPILNSPGPNQNLLQQLVTTADEARAAVRAQHEDGFRRVKVYSNLTGEAFEAIVDEAARLGMSVTGHSPEGMRTDGVPWQAPFDVPWEASVGRGFRTLEHVETVVWHALRDALDEGRMRTAAERLAAAGDTVTPTLIAHRRLVLTAQTRGAYLDQPGADTVNPFVRFMTRGDADHWSHVDASRYEAPHAAFFRTATRLLHEAGVRLIAGTDAGGFGIVPGRSMAQELALLVDAGLTPHEALAAATRDAADAIGFARTGVVAPGYRANLVLLRGDPLTDVGTVEHPAGVMVRGRWHGEQALQALRQAARDTSFTRSAWRAVELRLSMLGG